MMSNHLNTRFQQPPARPGHCFLALGGLLLLATLLAIFSLAFRGYYSGRETYFFLFKDLFLAWVPMGLSLLLVSLARRPLNNAARVSLIFGLTAAWVLFLPNAPYLLTEFIHLNSHHAPRNMRTIPIPAALNSPHTGQMPAWYDAFMLLLFAWNGLLLGVLSLRMVQQIARERFGVVWGWAGAVVLLLLSAFGVTLGRFERFNSWDILARPVALLADVASRLLRPFAHLHTTGATLLLGVFLLLSYVTIIAMMNAARAGPPPVSRP